MDVPPPPADPPAPEPAPVLPLKRRSREELAPETPEPDVEILALAGRLQDLIGRRREEAARRAVAAPRGNRLRPRQPVAPADPDAEVLAVLAQARAATPRTGRRYAAPNAEDQLEVLAARWLRRALWPGACALAALLAFTLGRRGAANPVTRVVLAPAPAVAPALAPEPAAGGTGRPTAPVPPPAVAAVPRWSDKTLAALEDVLGARRAGDAAQAGALARALRAEAGSLPGLDLFLAENALHARRPSEATAALLPMLRADAPRAEAAARLGFIAARSRRLDEAALYFGQACAADPFRGDYLARWAEALRRQGKSTEAVTRFDEALRRPADDEGSRPAPPGTAFRRRLARLEAGDVEPVRQETVAALKDAGPEAGRWLLTAAALELLDARSGPAAAALAKARAALPGAEWELLTGDLFFRNHATRKELAEFLPPAGSAADARRVAALDQRPEVDFVDP